MKRTYLVVLYVSLLAGLEFPDFDFLETSCGTNNNIQCESGGISDGNIEPKCTCKDNFGGKDCSLVKCSACTNKYLGTQCTDIQNINGEDYGTCICDGLHEGPLCNIVKESCLADGNDRGECSLAAEGKSICVKERQEKISDGSVQTTPESCVCTCSLQGLFNGNYPFWKFNKPEYMTCTVGPRCNSRSNSRPKDNMFVDYDEYIKEYIKVYSKEDSGTHTSDNSQEEYFDTYILPNKTNKLMSSNAKIKFNI